MTCTTLGWGQSCTRFHTFVTESSVGAAKKVLNEALDFAFLDVDVTESKTFEIAEILERKHVPYAFISASRQDQLPLELRGAPFIPKPFYAAQIEQAPTGYRSLISDPGRTAPPYSWPIAFVPAAMGNSR